jgi:uncharacterized protein YceK
MWRRRDEIALARHGSTHVQLRNDSKLDGWARVYGGVKTDLKCMRHLEGILSVFDIPFSAIVDTVLLPVTIWFEIFREKGASRSDRWSPLDEKIKP